MNEAESGLRRHVAICAAANYGIIGNGRLLIQQEAAAKTITAVEGAQEQAKQLQPQDKTTTERYEPSGFGTSIFAVVTSKKTRGKQINAIYDWTKFVDVTAD